MEKSIRFAQQLKKIMDARGLTQQDMAMLLGISQPAVSLYLRGRIPPADILLKLAEMSREKMEWLLTGSSTLHTEAVREHPTVYGTEHTLLSYWRQLKPDVRRNLLKLMEHLVKSPDV
jgi:predicted transcriptional regulator